MWLADLIAGRNNKQSKKWKCLDSFRILGIKSTILIKVLELN